MAESSNKGVVTAGIDIGLISVQSLKGRQYFNIPEAHDKGRLYFCT